MAEDVLTTFTSTDLNRWEDLPYTHLTGWGEQPWQDVRQIRCLADSCDHLALVCVTATDDIAVLHPWWVSRVEHFRPVTWLSRT